MKKIISLIIVLVMFTLFGCQTSSTHTHTYVEGVCECGEKDANYIPPHEHSFIDGICECGEKDPNVKEVDILSICGSGFISDDTSQAPKKMSARRLSSVRLNDEESEEIKGDDNKNSNSSLHIYGGFGGHKDKDTNNDGISDYAQYVVMYKSEKHINFTINLSNPKGHSIDAVQLTCDDPNAKIKVFNSDGTSTWELLSQAKDGYVINWASENAYRKTFYLETTAQEAINTLKVVDLKVNGEWQNKSLDNDELKIYKMEDEDLVWEFVTNTLEAYKWKMNKSENISSLTVYADGEEVVADENGIYSVGKDCVVEWEYEYTRDGVSSKWNDAREIEVLKIEYPDLEKKEGFFSCGYEWAYGKPYIGSFTITGTDLENVQYSVEYDEKYEDIEMKIAHWMIETAPFRTYFSTSTQIIDYLNVKLYVNGHYALTFKESDLKQS